MPSSKPSRPLARPLRRWPARILAAVLLLPAVTGPARAQDMPPPPEFPAPQPPTPQPPTPQPTDRDRADPVPRYDPAAPESTEEEDGRATRSGPDAPDPDAADPTTAAEAESAEHPLPPPLEPPSH